MDVVEELDDPQIPIAQACAALGISRATLYRQTQPVKPASVAVRGPSPRRLSDLERQALLDVLHSEEFVDQPPPEVYATLLSRGVYHASSPRAGPRAALMTPAPTRAILARMSPPKNKSRPLALARAAAAASFALGACVPQQPVVQSPPAPPPTPTTAPVRPAEPPQNDDPAARAKVDELIPGATSRRAAASPSCTRSARSGSPARPATAAATAPST